MCRGIVSSAAAILAAAVLAAGAGAATPPGNFKRHENRYWTWYAPQGWGASFGANDIYIGSPTGRPLPALRGRRHALLLPAVLTHGQRLLLLHPRQLPAGPGQNFDFHSFPVPERPLHQRRRRRRQIRNGYFRQVSRFQGRRRNGQQIKGEMVLDLFAVDPGSNVCGERQQVRSAPANGNGRSLRLLRIVQSVIFGPKR